MPYAMENHDSHIFWNYKPTALIKIFWLFPVNTELLQYMQERDILRLSKTS